MRRDVDICVFRVQSSESSGYSEDTLTPPRAVPGPRHGQGAKWWRLKSHFSKRLFKICSTQKINSIYWIFSQEYHGAESTEDHHHADEAAGDGVARVALSPHEHITRAILLQPRSVAPVQVALALSPAKVHFPTKLANKSSILIRENNNKEEGETYRWCVAHVFACPLRVLDTCLTRAGDAVRHAARVTTCVQYSNLYL